MRFKYKDDLAVHEKRFHTVTVAGNNMDKFIEKSAEKTAIVIQDPILIMNSDSDSEAQDVWNSTLGLFNKPEKQKKSCFSICKKIQLTFRYKFIRICVKNIEKKRY